MMNSSLTTKEHCYNSTSAWNNTPVYGHHGYHDQQQYPRQYVDPQLSYGDSQQYAPTTGRQYVVVSRTSYSNSAANTHHPRPYLDDPAFPRHQPPSADSVHQPDSAAATGSYASSGTGSAYSGACVDERQLPQLPDVVGGHLQGWTDHSVCSAQDFSQLQPGPFQFSLHCAQVRIGHSVIYHHLTCSTARSKVGWSYKSSSPSATTIFIHNKILAF